MQCIRPSDELRDSEAWGAATDLIEREITIASACWNSAELDSNLLVTTPASVCLNLEDLKCFEVVENQFHHYGIVFGNAIALEPSNPAYPPRSGNIVLMGAPKNGWLEVTFAQPVKKFSCYVTSSQRTTLTAFDPQDNLLVRASIESPNLAGSDSIIPPNALLKIEESNIARVTLYAFDGQLTVDDITFGC